LAEAGYKTACLSKLFPTRSHTVAAQVTTTKFISLIIIYQSQFQFREELMLLWEICMKMIGDGISMILLKVVIG
jgi:hypothetical protein